MTEQQNPERNEKPIPDWKVKRERQLRRRITLFVIGLVAAAGLLIGLFLSDRLGFSKAETAGTSTASASSETSASSASREEIVTPAPEETHGNDTPEGEEEEEEIPATLTDTEAPVLSGIKDRIYRIGDSPDLLEGVKAEDETDEKPEIEVEPDWIDTSVSGAYTVKYTATDESGNSAEQECRIEVAPEIAKYGDTEFGVYWDATVYDPYQPQLVAVNRAANTVTVYEIGEDGRYTKPVRAMVCSVGLDGGTPTGYYNTSERYDWLFLFGDVWGQYATTIYGNILFHSVPYFYQSPDALEYEEYNKLGEDASMGCIRMAVEDVKWLQDNLPYGFPCHIYDMADSPGPLGKPEAVKIDVNDEARRGWDPTDPYPGNPWNN